MQDGPASDNLSAEAPKRTPVLIATPKNHNPKSGDASR